MANQLLYILRNKLIINVIKKFAINREIKES